ncbi:MAG TPA: hypothetical protein VGO66_04960 [Solirubrobacterales bacterium]|nr:hypothetical protein [Solirubrobacterales bacterium]
MSRAAALVAVLLALSAPNLVAAPAAQASLAVTGFTAAATEPNGSPANLAGSHPYALTTTIGFSGGEVKDIQLTLPPGLIENPRAVPECTPAEFGTPRSSPHEQSRSGESCPDASQIGTIGIDTGATTRYFGLFNLAPAPGHPSQFGAAPFGAPLVFTPNVRQADGEYGLTLASRNVTQVFEIDAIELEIWGTPWLAGAGNHDGQRGNCLNETDPDSPHGQCKVIGQTIGTRAYLTLPSSCAQPLAFTVSADSWQAPGANASAVASGPAMVGCDQLSFSFGASAVPSTAVASSPSGLTLRLTTSQAGLLAPTLRLSSQPERATFALPEGMTLNPSIGAGLGACTPAQYAAESAASAPGEGCPNPAKIGTGTVETPLVEGALEGSLFIAKPFDNPFGSPYALYFVAKSPDRGFVVKVAGRLDADPRSGRLTATFDRLPRLPYSNLSIEFRQSQRAPLVSPAACGSYLTRIALRPWADPQASFEETSSFLIVRGAGGGACSSGGAPFAPRAVAGTLSSSAGFYSPFYLHLTRTDLEQEITSYSTVLPPGLLGKIAGIPFCSDAAIDAAKLRSGTQELQSPSCPAASEIGHTVSGYGAGLAPAYAPGRFYLAGPYHGAPLSVVAINSAIVGPFDLGTIVIRSAIQVDPRTARVTIDASASDPIPHIFAGIPLRLRDIRVYIDRPNFVLNPTSCAPFSITSTLTGSDAPFVNPKDVTASATVLYQLSNCSALKLKPRIAMRLKGRTKRGDYPWLTTVVTPRPGDTNLAAAAVTLPPSLFLEQGNIRDICTRPRSEADACPARSVVGRARADTPLLGEPMEGPVYLRSSDNPLPDLVAVIHGRGIRILLEGRVDSHRDGIRVRFNGLPDAPVSRFTMTIFGGRKRGILVNSENICRRTQRAEARLLGHSNAATVLKPRIVGECGGKGKR